MLKVLAASGVLATVLVPSAPAQADSAAATQPLQPIGVEVLAVGGSGCPQGTASTVMLSDNSAFAVFGNQYQAQVGAGASPADFRKNCQVSLRVNAPREFTYAIDRIYSYGTAHLEAGASATAVTSHYFQGSARTVRTATTFEGPRQYDWWVAEDIPAHSLNFAPCGDQRVLNVNTELRVYAGDSDPTRTTSAISRGTADGSVDIYHLRWKRC